jgi:hypothetical protein
MAQFSPKGKYPSRQWKLPPGENAWEIPIMVTTDAILSYRLLRCAGGINDDLHGAMIPYNFRAAYEEAISMMKDNPIPDFPIRNAGKQDLRNLLITMCEKFRFDDILRQAQAEGRSCANISAIDADVLLLPVEPRWHGQLSNADFAKAICIEADRPYNAGNALILSPLADLMRSDLPGEPVGMPTHDLIFNCYLLLTTVFQGDRIMETFARSGARLLQAALPEQLFGWIQARGFSDFVFIESDILSLFVPLDRITRLWYRIFTKENWQEALAAFAAFLGHSEYLRRVCGGLGAAAGALGRAGQGRAGLADDCTLSFRQSKSIMNKRILMKLMNFIEYLIFDKLNWNAKLGMILSKEF